MKSVTNLPEGYREVMHIDLQKDKRLAWIVSGLATVIMVIMFVAAMPLVPFSTLHNGGNMGKYIALLVGYVAYIFLHEAVHGIAMKHYCEAKVNYGLTGMYAYAGSEGYYCRKDYIVIALAPIAVWGIVLAILNFMVPTDWFYVVYLIQIGNISGAAGDLYVTWRMSKLPADILVKDTGISMTAYSREAVEEQ